MMLRPISPDDEASLFRIYASTRESEMALVDWTIEQKTAFLRMQFDAQHRYYGEQFPHARFDMVEYGGDPIGRLYVDRRQTEIHVIDIALLPEFRGKGLGARLMRDILQQGEEAGLPVTIHVEQFNPALRFYRRLGFREIRIEGIHLLMNWNPELYKAGMASCFETNSTKLATMSDNII